MLTSMNFLDISINANIFIICGTIFITGLLSGLSPCSLPTVTLIVAFVSGKKNNTKLQGFIISLGFILGIASTLTLLGMFAGSVGNLMGRSEIFIYSLSSILIFIGLWMLKVIKWGGGSNPMARMNVKKGSGVFGAFILGLPFGIVASPCTMPVTLAVLGFAAAKGSIIYGMLFMFIFAIGRSLPVLIAGTFTGFLKRATFFIKYEKVFEKVGGVLLLIIGFFLIITV